MNPTNKSRIKKILFWGLILGFMYAVATYLSDIENILLVARRGNPLILIAAFLVQCLAIYFTSLIMAYGVQFIGAKKTSLEALKHYLSTLFIGIANPIGTTASVLYMAQKLSANSTVQTSGAYIGLMLGQLMINLIFLLHLIIMIGYLEFMRAPGISLIVLALCLYLLLILVVIGIIYLALNKVVLFKKVAFWLRDFFSSAGGLLKNPFRTIPDEKFATWIDDFNISSRILTRESNKGRIIKFLLSGASVYISTGLSLYLVFLAFGVDVSWWQLFTAVGVIFLFTAATPTPYGIGFVEGISQIVLSAIGVPGNAAVVVTLVYRGISVWIPIMIGFLTFRHEEQSKLG